MLRRKLLSRIGLLILGFVSGAVVAIVLLQAVVQDVDRINDQTALLTEAVADLGGAIAGLQSGVGGRGDAGEQSRAQMLSALERLSQLALPQAMGPVDRLREFAASSGPVQAAPGELEADVRELGALVGRYVAEEHAAVGQKFRLLVLGLTLAAIVMVNTSVIVLLHTVHMILRPVDQLVDASRELAAEHFDYRVEIDQEDEFGELAHAYNRLAEQLAENEERKMETLRQVAVALNHDLNNTIAAIEMELRLVDRQTGGNPRLADRFARMHQSLGRVAHAMRQLAQIRRIVLTEYMPGQMMLDLERSAGDETESAAEQGPRPTVPPSNSPGVSST